jgi:hypothetical protein
MALLAGLGYIVTRAGASRGPFDVIGVGAVDVVLLQIKSGQQRLSPRERTQLQALRVAAGCRKECWTFRDRRRDPIVEVL